MSGQINITNDMSTLLKVPNKVLTEIMSKECLCIGSTIHDAILENQDVIILNIGIGSLSIEVATGQCKFVPSKELKATIKRSINEKIDPVEFELEAALREKLLAINEELNGQ